MITKLENEMIACVVALGAIKMLVLATCRATAKEQGSSTCQGSRFTFHCDIRWAPPGAALTPPYSYIQIGPILSQRNRADGGRGGGLISKEIGAMERVPKNGIIAGSNDKQL